MNESWKDIPGYESLYQVSNLGRVRSLDRIIMWEGGKRFAKGRILRQGLNSKGYMIVGLFSKNKRKNWQVHSLVALCFLGHEPNLKIVVDHIDHNPQNNKLENLQIITQSENVKRGKQRFKSKL